jgi:RNase P/RNase MRP subunit POP5
MEKSKQQFTRQDLSRIHSKEAKKNGGKVGSDSFTSRIQRTIATQESSGVLKPSNEVMQRVITKLIKDAREAQMDDDFE